MKNILLTGIMILGFPGNYFTLSAQENQKNCDIRQYAYYTNLAELSITDSAYQKAIAYYDSASQFIDSPFAKDRYNKSVCYALSGNYEECRPVLLYLAGKGLDRQIIIDNPAFKEFLASEAGKDFPELKIDLTYNIRLRAIYDSIHEADQYFRRKHPKNYHDYYHDTITKIDASNVKLMNELIVQYGWPTEDLIGISDLGFLKYEIIVILQSHTFQIYNYSVDILKALEKGLIDMTTAAYLILWSNSRDDFGLMEIGYVLHVFDPEGTCKMGEDLNKYQHKAGFVQLPDETRQKYNSRRKEFGLESIENFRRKIIFSYKDNRFFFKYHGGKSGFTWSGYEDYEYAVKNMVEF
ncbi:MAG TPA: hypothetical protein DF409_09610 [Bacteroidales bacterium]|nr:hypothetical protein [Bacteroidales bacterium]